MQNSVKLTAFPHIGPETQKRREREEQRKQLRLYEKLFGGNLTEDQIKSLIEMPVIETPPDAVAPEGEIDNEGLELE